MYKKIILYIGPLVEGSITTQRIDSMTKLGLKVIPLDIKNLYEQLDNPIKRRMTLKYNIGRSIVKINQFILEKSINYQFDMVWINKGIVVQPNTVKKLREMSKENIVIHYTADPSLITHKTRLFIKSIPQYTHCITTKSYELEMYKKYNPQKTLFVQQGYSEEFIKDREEKKNYKYDVVFIGRCEKHYVNILKEILKVTNSIAIWGPWEKYIRKYPELKPYWKGKSVFGAEYIEKLCEGRICLGLLCKIHPDVSTTRSFEIPATGSFLLAERTDEHLDLFKEGVEAEFFGDNTELLSKVKYYLQNERCREEIAKNGQKRCIEDGYSNLERIRYIFENVLGERL